MRHIGDRIRKRREQLGLSQSELARQLGLKPQSIQQWEDGRAQPRPKRYAGICEVLNISRAWLLSGSNDQATKFPTAKLIPLISWAQAGQWDGAVDMYRSGYAQEWAKAAGRIGARTFALRVEGEAMEPQFPPGAGPGHDRQSRRFRYSAGGQARDLQTTRPRFRGPLSEAATSPIPDRRIYK